MQYHSSLIVRRSIPQCVGLPDAAVHWFDHRGPHALAMPITLMTAPRVITPTNANPLRKAKQLSGTATASDKSRFMANVCLCLAFPPNLILARPPVRTTPSKKFQNRSTAEYQQNGCPRIALAFS
jgi:hypothetical protein